MVQPMPRPTRSSAAAAGRRGERGWHLAVEQAECDVLDCVEMIQEMELLEDEAQPTTPYRRQRPVTQPGHRLTGDASRPAEGSSRVPSRCSSVDFPDPDGPTTATRSPAR